MERHFTVTGFVVDGGPTGARTLLHWHPTLSIWLPPGGHIEPDEDPVQAVLREVLEETGMTVEIVAPAQPYTFRNVAQLPVPLSVIVADVGQGDGMHQHIDFAYATRRVAGIGDVAAERDHGFVWVSEDDLARGHPLPVASCGVDMPVVDDVREVALVAIRIAREVEAQQ